MSLDPANLSNLRVAELKKELKDRGILIPASGLKKSDLVAKLAEALGVSDTETVPDQLTESSPEAKITSTAPDTAVSTSAATALAVPAVTVTAAVPSEAPANGTAAVPAVESGDKASSEAPAKAAVVKVSGGDAKDRLAARAARFGTSGAAAVPTPAVSIGTSETLTALKKRTERFGEVVSSTVKSLEEKEKLNQRANRFNIPAEEQNPTTKLGLIRKVASPPSEATKRPITAMTPEEEERLRKRRERFGLT